MGGCCSQGAPYISYPYVLPFQIEQTFTIEGKRKGAELKLTLAGPRYSDGDYGELSDSTKVKISACGLAGLNARHKQESDFQDRVHFVCDDDNIFGFVLDGHGPQGKNMAETCKIFLTGFFDTNKHERFNHPDDKLFEDMFRLCNDQLRETYVPNEDNPDAFPSDDGLFSGV